VIQTAFENRKEALMAKKDKKEKGKKKKGTKKKKKK
jgi:hypothetical protein